MNSVGFRIHKFCIFNEEGLRSEFRFVAEDNGVFLSIEAQHVSRFSERNAQPLALPYSVEGDSLVLS